MPWIKVIEEEDADQKLSEAYSAVGVSRGTVANILKIHSIHPEVMKTHLGIYRELMFGRSELSRREREIIAVAVSVANDCHY